MVGVVDQIDNAVKGIAHCNKHIAKIEMAIQMAIEKDNLEEASKLEWTLVKWTEQLQHFIRMANQLGETSTDVTEVANNPKYKKKTRFESSE